MKEGPQPLTIEEYQQRQLKRKTSLDINIPKTTKPKRRGGYVQKLKRERAILIRETETNPPPSWERSTELWKRIDNIEFLINQRRMCNKN